MLSRCAQRRAPASGYGEGVVIGGDAEGLSLTLEAGHSMALLGRNGAGKTTLIASIAGLVRRHGGSIHLAGTDLTRRAPFERAAAGIGLVPQERNIFRSLLGRGEPDRGGASRPVRPGARLGALSAAGRAPPPPRPASSPAANSRCSPSRAP